MYQIDENTVKLLTDTIAIADKLIAGAEMVSASANDDSTNYGRRLLSDMNGEYFQCERFITCCVCHVSRAAGVSTTKYMENKKFANAID